MSKKFNLKDNNEEETSSVYRVDEKAQVAVDW